jgi:hypothetical protein
VLRGGAARAVSLAGEEAAMRWNRLILVVVLAAVCFGGTFTCKSHSGDHHDGSTVVVTSP